VAIFDSCYPKITGYQIRADGKTDNWLQALHRAVTEKYPPGANLYTLHLIDHPCLHRTNPSLTSIRYPSNANLTGIFNYHLKLNYQQYENRASLAKPISSLKKDCSWINDWETWEDAQGGIAQWMIAYDQFCVHSILRYGTPQEFESILIGFTGYRHLSPDFESARGGNKRDRILERFQKYLEILDEFRPSLKNLPVAIFSSMLAFGPAGAQISGHVYDVITGDGVENIQVSIGSDSTYTDENGYYFLPLDVEPPIQPRPPGSASRNKGPELCTIEGRRIMLPEDTDIGSYFNKYPLAAGPYWYMDSEKTQKILNLGGGNILYGKENFFFPNNYHNVSGMSLLNSKRNFNYDKNTTMSIDDIVDLTFRDENNPSTTGDYFDIERDSFVVNGALQHNEEIVPTRMTKISNPNDTTFVNYNYFMNLFGVVQGNPQYYLKDTWKSLGYDSVGVYIPPTPPQAHVDLHQAALNSINGTMAVNGYNGWNTLIADLDKDNNYPMFFIAPDCTYVVNNGGIYFVWDPNVPGNSGDNYPIRGPPSPLIRIRIDTDITIFLRSERIIAHEEGHCVGYSHASNSLYPWSIMNTLVSNYYIDPQTAAVTAIQHNRTDNNYGIIKNK